jgi:hypothetical protein
MRAGAVLAGALCVTTLAAAQGSLEPPPIPCQDSALFIGATLKCVAIKGREGNDNRAVHDLFATAGALEQTAISMTLLIANYQTYFQPYGEQDSIGVIKGFNKQTQSSATNWSAIKSEGNTSYMTFKLGNQTCIGFDHAGPLLYGGYAWLLRGIVCPPASRPADLALLKSFLAATRVGPAAENRNAFGQPVAPLPASPKPA